MKPDEKEFLKELQRRRIGEYTLQISERLGIPYKRAKYICLKWVGKNWYNYGVAWEFGWLTREGRSRALELGGRSRALELEWLKGEVKKVSDEENHSC